MAFPCAYSPIFTTQTYILTQFGYIKLSDSGAGLHTIPHI